MRITFVIPFLWLTGGIKVILEYASRLSDRGHHVSVVYPLVPYTFGRSFPRALYNVAHGIGGNLMRWNRISWWNRHNFELIPTVPVMFNWDRAVPEGDVVIATAWPTAYTVNNFLSSKGRKAYFIQHYETWGGVPEKQVDQTFSLPLSPIVIASWLRELAAEKSGRSLSEIPLVVNGVNLQQFHNPRKVFHDKKRVLMMYSSHSWKGSADGIRAFEIARTKHPDIRLVMFGLEKPMEIPDCVEFHHDPPQDKIAEIYSSCDIFLSPSWHEGCQLPPMEAMACQCAVVATNVGGIPDYAVAGETALVSEPRNPEALARNLIYLLDHEGELRCIAHAGYQHIQRFSWDRATDKLEAVLYSLVQSAG